MTKLYTAVFVAHYIAHTALLPRESLKYYSSVYLHIFLNNYTTVQNVGGGKIFQGD